MNKYLKSFLSAGVLLVSSVAFAGTPSFTGSTLTSTDENTSPTLFVVSADSATGPAPAPDIITSLTLKAVDDHALFQLDPQTLPSPNPGDPATARLSFITAPDYEAFADVGGTPGDNIYLVTVVAGDANGDTAEETFTITVNDINEAPVFTVGGNKVHNEDAGSITDSTFITDGQTGPSPEAGQTLTYNVSNNNNALFSVQPSISPTGSLTYTLADDANGVATVSVSLSDNGSNTPPHVNTSGTQQFTVTVNAVADAVDDGPLAATEDTALTLQDAGANDTFAGATTYSVNTDATNGTVVFTNAANGIFTYTPDADFNGADSFVYEVVNGGVTETATVTFNVSAVADAVADGPLAATEDTALTLQDAGANDTFAGATTYSVNTDATNGAVVFTDAANGIFTYTPDADFNGADSFIYQVVNGGVTETATVTFNVGAVADAIDDGPLAATEDTALTLQDAGANDTFAGATTYSVNTDATNGTVVFTNAANGIFTYTPDADFNGADSFIYQVVNGGVTETATVTFNVGAVADAVDDGPLAATEDTALTLQDAGANDTFAGATTYSVNTDATNGTVVFTNAANGIFTYTPDADFNGADSFIYQVVNGGVTETATVTFNVSAVADAVADGPLAATEDTALTLQDAGANDTFAGATTYSVNTDATNGTVTFTDPANGIFTYTPDADFNGADSFVYQVVNGGVTETATVTFNVGAVADAVADGPLAATEDTALTLQDAGANDTFAGATTYSVNTDATNGAVVFTDAANGIFTYTPNADYHGADSFIYEVANGGVTETATVTFNVGAVADAVADGPLAATEDTALTLQDAGANDTFAGATTYSVNTDATNGAVVFTDAASGIFTYTPNADFNGADSFIYEVANASGVAETATVTFNVGAVADAVADGPLAATEDTALTLQDAGANDTFAGATTYSVNTDATNGTVVFTNAANGIFTYTPDADFNGADSFVYEVANGGVTETATVTFNVGAVADAVDDGPLAATEDTALTLQDAGANDTFAGATTYSVNTDATNGTVTFTDPANGIFTYTPDADFNGADSFVYQVVNGGVTETATVTFNVSAVADAVADGPLAATEDTALTLQDAGANDTFAGATTYSVNTDATNGAVVFTDAANGIFTYTPDADYHGADSFIYEVANGGVTETATVTFNVGAVADAVADGPLAATEDTALTLQDAGANDTFAGATTYSVNTDATNGAVVFTDAANGIFTYTPNADYHGADSFIYEVANASGVAETATVTFNVSAVADAVADGPLAATEDTALTLQDAGANDTFAGATTYSVNTDATNGAVVFTDAASGIFTYTPNADFNGADSFIYEVANASGIAETATVTFNVSAVADAIDDGPLAATEDTALTLQDAGANDTFAGATTYSVNTDATNGTVVFTNAANGIFTYTPDADFNGADSFVYEVANGGVTETATVTFNVGAVADAVDDGPLAATEDTALTLQDAGANDTFAGATTYSVNTDATNGTVTFTDPANGIFTYTPDADFNGADSFVYQVVNGGVTETATVTFNVGAVADAVADGPLAATEDTPLTLQDAGANDTFAGATTYSVNTDATNGTVVFTNAANGIFTYTPNADYHGADSFIYEVANGGVTETATVTFNVGAVADAVADGPLAATEDTALTLQDAGANDTFAGATTYSVNTDATNGTVTFTDPANGVFTYTPNADYHGADSFIYEVANASGVAETATVTFNVSAVADAVADGPLAATEDTALTLQDAGANDTFAGATTYSVNTDATNGTVVFTNAASGVFTYTPDADFNGADSFVYEVANASGVAETATVTFNVGAVADAVDDGPLAATEDTALTLQDAGANDTFAGATTYSVNTDATNGTVVFTNAANGIFTYTPDADFNGADSFVYEVANGGVTETATVTFNVGAVADAVDDGPLAATEDTALTLQDAGANDTFAGATTYSVNTDATNGTVVFTNAASGVFTYTPDADFNGADSFIYQVVNGGVTETATVTFNVVAVADAVADGPLAATEDTALTLQDAGANDTFAGATTYSVNTDATNGTVTFTDPANGIFTYTPNADYHGADSFIYEVANGGVIETATVTFNVGAVADAVADGPLAATEDTALTLQNAGANDTFAGATTYSVNTDATNGTVTFTDPANGIFTYTPDADYHGADSFIYEVANASGVPETATVTFNVGAVADAIDDGPLAATEDTALTLQDAGANDTFAGATTYSVNTDATNGTVVFTNAANGIFTYTPDADFNGADSFIYEVANASGVAETATVTFNVGAVADAIDDGPLAATEDTALTLQDAGANDTFAGATTYSVNTDAANGTVVFTNAANGIFTYTPDADFNGADSFIYQVVNGGVTETATVTFNVGAVADAVADGPLAATEDAPLIGVDAGANDTFAGATTYSVNTDATNGTVVFTNAANGIFTYTPDADYHGADSFIYEVANGGVTETATVTFNVSAVVDTADDGPLAATEDTPLTGADAKANDTFTGATTYSVNTDATNGTVVFTNAANGIFTYTPNADYHGADSFIYEVANASGVAETATVTFNVSAVADAVDDGPLAATEDTALTLQDAGANDTFAGATTYSVNTDATNGTVTFTDPANGIFTYTPDADFNGADSFIYEVANASGVAETATVTFNVSAVADATDDGPLAATEDTALTLQDAGANDTFAGATTYSVNTDATNGTVVFTNAANGIFTYTPDADFNGADSFIYQVVNGGVTETATVNFNVGAVADAVDDGPLAATEDTALTLQDAGANDTFAGATTYSVNTDATNGTVTFTDPANGIFTYTPDADFNGADSFVYQVVNGGVTETATVTFNVGAVADAVADGPLAAIEDAPLIGVDAGVNDTFAGATTYSVNTDATNGTVVFTNAANGIFTYTPDADYHGADSFIYEVANGGVTETATVTFNVSAVVDTADDGPLAATEDTPLTGADAKANDTFTGATTYSVNTDATNGTVVFTNAANGIFTYTPNADYHGADSFIYEVANASGVAETATVTFNVSAVADAVADGPLAATEDTALTLQDAGANDTFAGATTYSVNTDATNGTVTFTDPANGIFTYTPDADFNGGDSFVYEVANASGVAETATVTFSVGAVADAIDDGPLAATEDTALTLQDAGANDTFAGATTYSVNTDATNGTVVFTNAANGIFTYTPDADFNGADSFIYQVVNGGVTETATVTFNVGAVADAVDDGPLAATEDTALTLQDAGANDTFAGATTYSVNTDATNGTVVFTNAANGIFTYTPDADFNGADSFIYEVANGGVTETATVTFNVGAVADAVADGPLAATEDTALTLQDAGVNDTFAGATTYSVNTDATNGTVVFTNAANGIFTYTPDADYHGADSFIYEVANGGVTETATVTFNVSAVVDTADDGPLAATEDTALTLQDAGANDTFAGATTYSVNTDATNGTVTFTDTANGIFTYTPDADFNGADSFIYEVANASGVAETATVTFNVSAVADAVDDGPLAATEDTALTLQDAKLNDTFAGATTYSVNTDATNGTVVFTNAANGIFTYTPNADYHGADSFIYEVANGGVTETATVTFNVGAVVDAVNDGPLVATEDTALTLQDAGANDTFAGATTYSVNTDATNGTVVFTNAANGIFTYTPDADYHGADSFIYEVANASGVAETATVTFNVSAVADAIDDGPLVATEDTPLTLQDAGANDTFTGATTYSVNTNATNGTVTFTDAINGIFTYTPNLNYNGADSFIYEVANGSGVAETATVTFSITPVNDAPILADGAITTAVEDGPTVNLNLSPLVTDVDTGDTHTFAITSPLGAGEGSALIGGSILTFDPGADFQDLANGETRDVTLGVTATDNSGIALTEDSNQNTVTVTVTGTNDAPVLSVEVGDDVDETLTETNGGLAVANSITVTDVDVTNLVSSSVLSVAESGNVSGILNGTLLAMMGISGDLNGIETTEALGWSFNSGGEAFDYLLAGEQLILTYTVQVDDGTAQDTANIIVRIDGSNDAPVLSVEVGDDVDETVTETNAGLAVANTITLTDVDIRDTTTSSVLSVAESGDVSGIFNGTLLAMMSFAEADGGASGGLDNDETTELMEWSFNSGGEAFDYLTAGEQLVLTYTVQVDDGDAQDTANIIVRVDGSNDAPVLSVEFGDDVDETLTETNAGLAVANSITVTDVDVTDLVTSSVLSVAESGNVSGILNGTLLAMMGISGDLNGTETTEALAWSFNSGAEAFDYLHTGEQLVLTYTVQVDDGDAQDTADIIIRVDGTNDAPVLSVEIGDDVDETLTETNAGLAVANSITVTDLDVSDLVSSSVLSVAESGNVSGILNGTLLAMMGISGDLNGTETTEALAWSFNSGAEAFDYLHTGEQLVLTYTVQVDDGDVQDTANIIIRVDGTNDAPVLSVEVGDDVDETLTETNAGLAVANSITVTDLDVTDLVTSSVLSVAESGDVSGIANLTLLGMMGISGDLNGTETTEALAWSFNSGGEAFDYLTAGQQLILTYTVQVDDGDVQDTADIIVRVDGSNDAPIVDFSGFGDVSTGAVTETNATNLTDNGTLTVADVDIADVVTLSTTAVVPVGLTNGISNATFMAMLTYSGGLSNAEVLAQRTWTFDSGTETFDYLDAGDILTLTYTVTADDTIAQDTAQITITVTGTNDLPTTTGIGNQVNVDGDTPTLTNITGSFAPSADTGDSIVSYAVAAGSTDNFTDLGLTLTVAGLITGTIDFDASQGSVDADGIYSITIEATDDDLQTVSTTFTWTVTNVAPVATNNTAGILEDAINVIGNVLTDNDGFGTDADGAPDGDALVVSAITFGATPGTVDGATALISNYGDLVIAANGGYTYTLDNTNTDVQGLGTGDTLTETFTYTLNDGEGGTDTATLVVTITGTNDAPVVNDQTFNVDENSPNGTVVGTLIATNAEPLETLTYALTGTAFAIDGTGQITVADSTQLDREATASIIVTATVTDNGSPIKDDNAIVTIDLNPINDNAPVGNDDTITVDELATVVFNVITGGTPDTDADLPAEVLTVTAVGGDPTNVGVGIDLLEAGVVVGTLTIGPTGAASFVTNPDNTVEKFEVTQTYTVSDGTFDDVGVLVTISVNPINDNQPAVTADGATFATDGVEYDEGTQLVTSQLLVPLNAYFSDLDIDEDGILDGSTSGDNDSLVFTVVGNTNTTLVSTSISDADLFIWSPAQEHGSADITIRATDTANPAVNISFVELTFTVTVNSINDPPTFVGNFPDLIIEEDDPPTVLPLALSFSDIDLDGDSDPSDELLTFRITIEDTPNPEVADYVFDDSGVTLISEDFDVPTAGARTVVFETIAGSASIPLVKDSHGQMRVTVRATDLGRPPLAPADPIPLFVERTFTITVFGKGDDTPDPEDDHYNDFPELVMDEDGEAIIFNVTTNDYLGDTPSFVLQAGVLVTDTFGADHAWRTTTRLTDRGNTGDFVIETNGEVSCAAAGCQDDQTPDTQVSGAEIGDLNIVYKPHDDFNGEDTFTYCLRDAFPGSEAPFTPPSDIRCATVTILVNPVNDLPRVPADIIYTMDQAGELSVNATEGLASKVSGVDNTHIDGLGCNPIDPLCTPGPSDPQPDQLYFFYDSAITNDGQLLPPFTDDGAFTYRPAATFSGSDSFVFDVCETPTPTVDSCVFDLVATIVVDPIEGAPVGSTDDVVEVDFDLADIPLELPVGPESNVLIVNDDSGSMAWDILTDQSSGRYFFETGNGLYYVMKATAGSSTYVAPGEEDAPDVGLWRLRNATYNTVYYNPEVRYDPWEGLDPDGNPFPQSTPTSALHNPMAPSGSTTNLRLPQDYTGRAVVTEPRVCTIECRRYRRGRCVSTREVCTGGTSFQRVDAVDLYLPRYYIWQDSASTGVVGELDATPSPITEPATSEGILVEIRPAGESGGYPVAGSGTYPKGTERTDCAGATTCTFDEELQNFANWFTYSRNREYTAKSALGKVVAESENIKIGYAKLNSRSNTKRIVSMNTSERTGAKAELLDAIYLTGSSGGTPLRRALRNAGRHFECRSNDIFSSSSNSSPGDANCPVEAAPSGNCQQNYTLLITDGTWNGSSPNIGDSDDDNNTNFDGGMYAHSYNNSLADVAMHYYERDLHGSLSNEVPTSSRDVDGAADTAFENSSNELMHQHMKTYTIGFGVNGEIEDDDVPTDYTVTTFNWGNPTTSRRKIDDVRHAAVNGRGEYLSAGDADKLADALVAAFEEFQQGSGAASAVSFNSQEILEDTLVFRSFYNTKNNTGNLLAQTIEPDGTVVEEPVWEAAERMDLVAPLDREIITLDRMAGSPTFNQGIPFLPASLNSDQRAAFSNEPAGAQQDLEVNQRVLYLRGDDTNERPTGNFRERPGIEGRLGDIVHSAPTFIGIPSRLGRDIAPFPQGTGNLYSDFREANENRQPVVYVNANDGMLHGFNAETGDELIAYVPDVQMTGVFSENIAQLLGFDYDHKYLVDSTPAVNDVYIDADGDGDKEWRTILVSGHGKGAKSYFALDITDPTKFNEATANDVTMWEFTDADDTYPTDSTGAALRTDLGGTREDLQTPPQPVKDLGYTFSVPTLVMTNVKDAAGDNRWVSISGNGYNSTAGIAKLLILFLDGGVDGEWCHPDRRHDVVLDGPPVACGDQDFIKMDTGFGVFGGLPNGLGEPRAIDVDGNGTVDYVYAGDMQGNFFRFDLTDPDFANWTTTKIFEAKYKPGTVDEAVQPITTQPIAIIHPTEEEGFIIVFGTGAYMRTGDSTDSAIQSVYGIWDRLGPELVTKSELQEQTFTNVVDPDFGRVRTLTANDVNYGAVAQKGWFIDLDSPPAGFADGTTPEFPGEKAVRNIQLRGGLAFVNSVFPRTLGSCVGQAGGATLSFCPDTGGSGCFENRTVFDLNNDGAFDAGDDIGTNMTAAGIILEDPSPPTDSTFIGDKRVTQYGRQLHIIGTNTSSGDNTGRLSWKRLQTN